MAVPHIVPALVAMPLCLGAPLFAPTAQDTRGEIEVNGARSLALSPSGDLWIGSRDGRLYVSRDWNASWKEVTTPARHPGELDLGGDELEHMGFFDAKRAIVCGWIGGDARDEILRTEDGGETWSLVKLPLPMWVYDAQVMADGHAWLVGSEGKLLGSSDFGATWRVISAPFDGLRRSSAVCFDSVTTGVVGASIDALQITVDGGRTWTPIQTPVDALIPLDSKEEGDQGTELVTGAGGKMDFVPLPAGHQDRIERIWIGKGQLLVLQRGVVYRHPLAAKGEWSAVEFDGHTVQAAESSPGGFVMITDDRHVLHVSSALEKLSISTQALDDRPWAVAAGERGCAFLTDVRGRVCTLTKDDLQCSRLHTLGTDRAWPLADFDRVDDTLWYGVSSSALYRSKDGAKTWERLLEAEGASRLFAVEDGSTVTLDVYSGLARWESGKPGLQPVLKPAEHEHGPSLCARQGRLWIADSFQTDGSKDAEDRLNWSDTVIEGDAYTAIVYASADEGRTWKVVDRCRGSVVGSVWLGQDDVVCMCMTDGSIRSGKIEATTATVAAPGFATIATRPAGLGGQYGSWLLFPTPAEGWVGGYDYFGGASVHRSHDGGRSWELLTSTPRGEPSPFIEAFRLGRGSCVRIVGFWDEDSHAEVWRDGDFHASRKFEHAAHDARVDAGGNLLVRLDDASVWSLAADASEWKRVGSIQMPPR